MRRACLFTSLAVLVLDQVTKGLAHAFLRHREPFEVIPGLFNLTYSRNPGGLFGYFRELPDLFRVILLTLFPLAAVVLIVAYLFRAVHTDRPTRWGLSLILGGALGNLVDRFARGEVIDFLDLFVGPSRLADWLVAHLGTAHWPTFNVADSAIVVGAGLLLVSIVWPGSPAGPGEPRAR